MELDISKVRDAYSSWEKERHHYIKIDKEYYGNTTDTIKRKYDYLDNDYRCDEQIKLNFQQKLIDEESNYSFANPVNYKAIDDYHKEAVKKINYLNRSINSSYVDEISKKLVEFKLVYEIQYTTPNKEFKVKCVSPLDGYMYFNQYDEAEMFLYMHGVKVKDDYNNLKIVNYIDVYTDDYVYYLDDKFNIIDSKPHYLGSLPVSYGIVDNVKYNMKNGYHAGDKTIHRTISKIQIGMEHILTDAYQEINDTRNASLIMYGTKPKPKKGIDGKPILDGNGNVVYDEPNVVKKLVFWFKDRKTSGIEWLIKKIDGSFIDSIYKKLYDNIFNLSSHIDTNEKLQSNLSGLALRTRMVTLEEKCKANERAMEDIHRGRIKRYFHWLKVTNNGVYDQNMIEIVFTPCVPQDLVSIADCISKIPHEVMSNETKMSMLPVISDIEAEKQRISKEKEQEMDIDFDKMNMDINSDSEEGEIVDE